MQCQNNLNAKYICMIYNLIAKVYTDESPSDFVRQKEMNKQGDTSLCNAKIT